MMKYAHTHSVISKSNGNTSFETCKSSPDMVGYYIPAIVVVTGTGSLSFLPRIFTAVTVMK